MVTKKVSGSGISSIPEIFDFVIDFLNKYSKGKIVKFKINIEIEHEGDLKTCKFDIKEKK